MNMKRNSIWLCSVFAGFSIIVWGCSSSDSPSTNSGGNTAGTAGSAASSTSGTAGSSGNGSAGDGNAGIAGNASAGSGGGISGPGGSSGGGSAGAGGSGMPSPYLSDCQHYCEQVIPLQCANENPESCVSDCTGNYLATITACIPDYKNYIDCVANKTTNDYECSSNGSAVIKPGLCSVEIKALIDCVNAS
jgi:hypothetical protein